MRLRKLLGYFREGMKKSRPIHTLYITGNAHSCRACAVGTQRARTQLKSREGWVFPSVNDTPLNVTNWRDRRWPQIVRKTGMAHRTLYTCRHSYATLMLGYRTVQWVAHQMGHRSIAMVVDLYSRWIKTPENRGVGEINADIARAMGEEKRLVAQGG